MSADERFITQAEINNECKKGKKTRRGEKNRELERKNNAHDFVNCVYK